MHQEIISHFSFTSHIFKCFNVNKYLNKNKKKAQQGDQAFISQDCTSVSTESLIPWKSSIPCWLLPLWPY